MKRKSHRHRSGFSLVEVAVCSMLVGVVLVGAMECVGAVIRGRATTGDELLADQLASQLMAEILATAYAEPDVAPIFGRESESAAVRTDWDDVDDYHLWAASPPVDRNGMMLANTSNWQRAVTVQWVEASDPTAISVTDQGVKRVTVTVQKNGQIMSTRVSLRSDKY